MTQWHPDRRTLLGGAGLILLSGFTTRQVWAAPSFTEDPFQLGVAAGDPAPDGFVIWTRLAPKPLEEHGGMPIPPRAVRVQWEVAEDEGFTRTVRTGEALARPELAHSVHVEVEGLLPHRLYWYRFTVAGAARSQAGRARTLPLPGSAPDSIRIAVAGCQNYEHGFFDIFRHIAGDSELDAVFHYGDYIYEGNARPLREADARGRRLVRGHLGGEPYSLDDYRRRYAQYKSDPDLRAAHAAAAFVMSFDDHEVDNNWASEFDQDGTPPEMFALRRLAAMQAWYEHMPVRRAQFPTPTGLKMFRRLDFGTVLRMHVLDTRSYRDDQPCASPDEKNCRQQETAQTSILGREQESWLAGGLSARHGWNLIAQQVLMMPLVRRDEAGRELPGFLDTWNGYAPARKRLVKAITDRQLTNVVVASGDAHQTWIGTVPLRDEAPDGGAAAAEFLCTSATSEGDGVPISPQNEALLRGNPNLKFAGNQRGYQLFEVTAKEWRTDVRVIDRVSTSGGTLRSAARYVVTPDAAKLHDG